MSERNPFKIIEEENVRKFREHGPKAPVFINNAAGSSVNPPSNYQGSPSFPSFS